MVDRRSNELENVFIDNESCAKHLAKQRWPDGFVCPRCGYQDHWYLSKRNLYDCKNCRHQTSVTAGTLFHQTHVPLRVWYRMIYTMALMTEGVSIDDMQEKLGIGCYETAWKKQTTVCFWKVITKWLNLYCFAMPNFRRASSPTIWRKLIQKP